MKKLSVAEDLIQPRGICRCGQRCPGRFICVGCDEVAVAAQDRDAAIALAERLHSIGIPARFASAELSDFQTGTPKRKKALAGASRWASAPAERPFLYLFGPPGRGKTFLGVAAMKTLVRRSPSGSIGSGGLMINADAMIRTITETFKPHSERSEREVLRRYCETRCLVIDDLGVRKATPFAISTFFSVVEERYANARPTVITSNRSITEFGEWVATCGEPLEAERILSRLAEVATGYELDGPDLRVAGRLTSTSR